MVEIVKKIDTNSDKYLTAGQFSFGYLTFILACTHKTCQMIY